MSHATSALAVTRVTTERRTDRPLVDTPTPRLSWTIESSHDGWRQARAHARLDGQTIARVEGDASVFVPWPFEPLAPHSRHTVEVRVEGEDGSESEWSEPLVVEAAFLAEGEWAADFIGLADPAAAAAPALVRGEFDAPEGIVRATLYAAAHGVYQVQVNGSYVDDAVLKPGWTSYQYRLVHETTDVTALVRPGRNAIGICLAGGWWTESYGFRGQARPFYGEQPDVAAQLHLELADGTTRTVTTGADWTATGEGPILSSGIYAGEEVDARRAPSGWSSPGFDASAWRPVRVVESAVVPEAAIAEPVRRVDELPVQEVITTPSGATVVDFGQNLVGRVRVRVSGQAGQTITLRHAEVLEHGELGTRPLRFAKATDRFTLAGGGEEVFEAEFTFHGFRYAEISGWPGELDPSALTAVVISSDMRRTGWFECSDPLVNRLHENVVWGMRGNFVSLPTDCPQRDERLGWTGDIQVFAPTASYLFDSDGFLSSWLRDVAHEQKALGGICPIVVPSVLTGRTLAAAAWGDAATIVPTVLHERFADLRTLDEQYPSMRAWVDYLRGIVGDDLLWEHRFQFGDWLDPAAPPEYPGDARTSSDLVATAYFLRSTQLVARAAEVLGHDEDARRYARLAEDIRQAFLRAYVTPAGRMVSDASTAYALALRFDIVTDPAQRQALADRLAELVRAEGYHMSTGFVGTPLIQDALVEGGHAAEAERLLLQTENPSWLYAVTMGATTIWERWDSMLEDGTINPGEMTSFNHYAFGAVADWLHRRLAGLAPAAPGYRRIRVAPLALDSFDYARTAHETRYGRIEAGWRREGDDVVVEASIPANTSAEIVLPGSSEVVEVGSGRHEWRVRLPRRTPPTGPLTIDSPLADVLERPEAYRAIVEELSRRDGELAATFRRRTRWVRERSLRDALERVPGDVVEGVGRALEHATA